jgi:hypothetical protein
MSKLRLTLALVGCVLLMATGYSSPVPTLPEPPPPIQVEFMASETSWTKQEYVGHAFMCISIPLNSGVKEDCYGFYPRVNSLSGYVGGPGVAVSEFQKNPSRFSRVNVSIKKPITDEQRRAILKLVNEWNSKKYDLTDQSCIDFVNTIAQKLNWRTPKREATDLPETYLKKLADANK